MCSTITTAEPIIPKDTPKRRLRIPSPIFRTHPFHFNFHFTCARKSSTSSSSDGESARSREEDRASSNLRASTRSSNTTMSSSSAIATNSSIPPISPMTSTSKTPSLPTPQTQPLRPSTWNQPSSDSTTMNPQIGDLGFPFGKPLPINNVGRRGRDLGSIGEGVTPASPFAPCYVHPGTLVSFSSDAQTDTASRHGSSQRSKSLGAVEEYHEILRELGLREDADYDEEGRGRWGRSRSDSRLILPSLDSPAPGTFPILSPLGFEFAGMDEHSAMGHQAYRASSSPSVMETAYRSASQGSPSSTDVFLTHVRASFDERERNRRGSESWS